MIPREIFDFVAPLYHSGLTYLGAIYYGFPSKDLKIIGVTGTKGKSTVVYLVAKLLESKGESVAMIGSLGYKIKEKEWPNTLKMSMPGRFKLQRFLYEAKNAGCKFVVMEVTSEGIKQKRHLGIKFDCAVFTNLHREHIESHGSFDKYYKAKQELFVATTNIHVLNGDDDHVELFSSFPSKQTIFYGLHRGDLVAGHYTANPDSISFETFGTQFNINLGGEFNILNCLAALATVSMYGVDLPSAKPVLESIKFIPGRMEWIQKEPFGVVVDYAHTPDSLEHVYKSVKPHGEYSGSKRRLICVLGAAGGGRDRWKRPEFGKIASKYCDEIILTNEDPYDENPLTIIKEIESGFSKTQNPNYKFQIIEDRKEAIGKALSDAQKGDVVIVTGKGSENSMAVAGGKKISWSDKKIILEFLN